MKNRVNRALAAKKKVLFALMAIATIAMVGCKPRTEDPQPQPQPEPQPQSETYTVYYLSDCIGNAVQYTYTDNNGETQTLKKDNWVAIDTTNVIDQDFLRDLAPFCERKFTLTPEVLGHLKKFVVPNQPKAPVMKKVVKAKDAVLPEEGTPIIVGKSVSSDVKRTATIYSPDPDLTDEQKWNSVLNYAERIF